MKTKIRPATPLDVPDILNFIKQLAVFEKLEHEVSATEETLRTTLFGSNPRAEVVFMEEAGVKVGFALFFHNYSTFLGKPGLYLEDLFVLPSHRKRGYGKRLLSHLAKVAVERGCGRFEWSVLDWNKTAIDLYLSMGSKPMDEWTVHRVTGQALQSLASSAIDG